MKFGIRFAKNSAIRVDHISGSESSRGSATATLKVGRISKPTTVHIFDWLCEDLLLGSREADGFRLSINCSSRRVTQDDNAVTAAVNAVVTEDVRATFLTTVKPM